MNMNTNVHINMSVNVNINMNVDMNTDTDFDTDIVHAVHVWILPCLPQRTCLATDNIQRLFIARKIYG